MTGSTEASRGSSPVVGTSPVRPGEGSERVAGRVPDFFLVGHPKSGTTALYEMLRRHPQLYMPALKEPCFLAPDQARRLQRVGSGPLPQTMEEYTRLFAAAEPEQRVGEATSAYLVSRQAPRRIAELQPAARIVAILREPASLLHSLHLQLIQDHIEDQRDLRTAISLESARARGEHVPPRSPRPQALQYSERIRFAEQLKRYHEVFPREQVMVLVYDDFRRENVATVRKVLRFLEVDDRVGVQATEANPTVRVRSQRLDELVHSVSAGRGPAGRALKGAVKAIAPRRVRRGMLGTVRRRLVHAQPQPVDERLMLELRRRYREEVVAASEYLGRDLVSLWGYDRLD